MYIELDLKTGISTASWLDIIQDLQLILGGATTSAELTSFEITQFHGDNTSHNWENWNDGTYYGFKAPDVDNPAEMWGGVAFNASNAFCLVEGADSASVAKVGFSTAYPGAAGNLDPITRTGDRCTRFIFYMDMHTILILPINDDNLVHYTSGLIMFQGKRLYAEDVNCANTIAITTTVPGQLSYSQARPWLQVRAFSFSGGANIQNPTDLEIMYYGRLAGTYSTTISPGDLDNINVGGLYIGSTNYSYLPIQRGFRDDSNVKFQLRNVPGYILGQNVLMGPEGAQKTYKVTAASIYEQQGTNTSNLLMDPSLLEKNGMLIMYIPKE